MSCIGTAVRATPVGATTTDTIGFGNGQQGYTEQGFWTARLQWVWLSKLRVSESPCTHNCMKCVGYHISPCVCSTSHLPTVQHNSACIALRTEVYDSRNDMSKAIENPPNDLQFIQDHRQRDVWRVFSKMPCRNVVPIGPP